MEDLEFHCKYGSVLEVSIKDKHSLEFLHPFCRNLSCHVKKDNCGHLNAFSEANPISAHYKQQSRTTWVPF